jgi:hypothetical protein
VKNNLSSLQSGRLTGFYQGKININEPDCRIIVFDHPSGYAAQRLSQTIRRV